MFERYTEAARRVIFWSRASAGRFGSQSIDADHLVLGLLREDAELVNLLLGSPDAADRIGDKIAGQILSGEPAPESANLPFTEAGKRVLKYSMEESGRLRHKHIGTGHLLLGLLHEREYPAAAILEGSGLRLEEIRVEIARLEGESRGGEP